MKKALILAACSVTLFSCQKEVLPSKNHFTTAVMTVSDYVQEKHINLRTDVTLYNNRYTITGQFYNECTNENVVISGLVKDHLRQSVINDSILLYNFESDYTGVKGIGLTSGNVYFGKNQVNIQYKSVKDIFGAWNLTTETVSGNLTFSTKDGQTYTSSAYYHAILDSDGNLYFDKIILNFYSCN